MPLLERLTLPDVFSKTHDNIDQLLCTSIENNLNNLLNTKIIFSDCIGHYVEVEESLLSYGMSCFGGLNSQDDEQKIKFAKYIALLLEKFEKRLKQINVILKGQTGCQNGFLFNIEGKILTNLGCVPVCYEGVCHWRQHYVEVRKV